MLWLLFVEFFISAMPTRFSSNDFRGQVSLFCVCECVSVWVCECVCVCEGYGTLPGGAPARFPVAGDFPTKRWCRDWFNFRRLGAKIDSIHRLTLNWYICMYIFFFKWLMAVVICLNLLSRNGKYSSFVGQFGVTCRLTCVPHVTWPIKQIWRQN